MNNAQDMWFGNFMKWDLERSGAEASDKKIEKSLHFDSKKVAYIFPHPSHMAIWLLLNFLLHHHLLLFLPRWGNMENLQGFFLDWDKPLLHDKTGIRAIDKKQYPSLFLERALWQDFLTKKPLQYIM